MAIEPKYKLVRENTMERDGYTLYQIRACKTFILYEGVEIKEGELGGYVAIENNLSQEGNCWIFETCAAYENAQIKDDASIAEYTFIHGNAVLRDSAIVQDYVEVAGNVEVSETATFKGYYGAVTIVGNIGISGDTYDMTIKEKDSKYDQERLMAFFSSLHIETTKVIKEEDIMEDLEKILAANGYQIVGNLGRTTIPNDKEIHKAWKEHYTSIESAW